MLMASKEELIKNCKKFYEYAEASIRNDEEIKERELECKLSLLNEEKEEELKAINDGTYDRTRPWVPQPLPVHKRFLYSTSR